MPRFDSSAIPLMRLHSATWDADAMAPLSRSSKNALQCHDRLKRKTRGIDYSRFSFLFRAKTFARPPQTANDRLVLAIGHQAWQRHRVLALRIHLHGSGAIHRELID